MTLQHVGRAAHRERRGFELPSETLVRLAIHAIITIVLITIMVLILMILLRKPAHANALHEFNTLVQFLKTAPEGSSATLYVLRSGYILIGFTWSIHKDNIKGWFSQRPNTCGEDDACICLLQGRLGTDKKWTILQCERIGKYHIQGDYVAQESVGREAVGWEWRESGFLFISPADENDNQPLVLIVKKNDKYYGLEKKNIEIRAKMDTEPLKLSTENTQDVPKPSGSTPSP